MPRLPIFGWRKLLGVCYVVSAIGEIYHEETDGLTIVAFIGGIIWFFNSEFADIIAKILYKIREK